MEAAIRTQALPTLLTIREELKAELVASPASDELRYLIGYVNWRASHLLRGNDDREDQRDALLEEAQATLEALIEKQPKDGEAHALLASVLGARIQGSFFRGFSLGPKASSLFDKALELAPDSPRVALLRGIRAMFTPSMFGGGLDVAAAELDRAHALFDKVHQRETWPNWGRIDVFAWRGQVLAKQGHYGVARVLYERGLSESPDDRWIRYGLLPALNKAAAKQDD